MKLWILKPVDNLPKHDDPWKPWCDKALGFVVRAETEEEARKLAHEQSGDENPGAVLGNKIADTNSPWLDAKCSTCAELTAEGEVGVVLRDFRAA